MGKKMRRCSKCYRELPEEAFNWHDKEQGRRYSWCRKCRAPIDKAYKDKKRRELLEHRRQRALDEIHNEEDMGYPSGCPLLYDEKNPDPRDTLRKIEQELREKGWM